MGTCSNRSGSKRTTIGYDCCRTSIYKRDSLVMVGEHVTLDAGTGCVHTAPGHGEDDYHIGKQIRFGHIIPVDNGGCYTNEAPGFEGYSMKMQIRWSLKN